MQIQINSKNKTIIFNFNSKIKFKCRKGFVVRFNKESDSLSDQKQVIV